MNKIEILSPAGSFESVVAAVRSGADAIYVGLKEFSARASATNFDIDELREVVKYSHERNTKVYLALNTLLFDDEIDRALYLVKKAAQCDIDALIVQDIGLAQAVREVVPTLRLHASTQMSVHTLSGAKALYEMGFSRVVLAREMTKAEIKHIADNCPIELEVFVHGALCMCVSGQCYMSAFFGGRSANRGMCAQPCRLPFATDGSTHALSLKDNSIINYINELQDIGVTSAKIEGRMKRPEYVASATNACVQMRDFSFVDEKTKEQLRSVFSRTGFTDGYYTDHRGHDMFGYRQKADVVSASEKLLRKIRNTYKDETPRVDVDFTINVSQEEPVSLSASDGDQVVAVYADIAQKAVSLPITEEKLTSYLQKTGNTPYKVRSVTCNIKGDVFVSAKDINALRRLALDRLSEDRHKYNNHKIIDKSFDDFIPSPANTTHSPLSRARVRDLNIPDSFSDFERVFVPLFDCVNNPDNIHDLTNKGIALGVDIPRSMFSQDEKIADALIKAKSLGITQAMCHNIGAVYLCKTLNINFHLGYEMNLSNSLSLSWAKQYGAQSAQISIELDIDRINALQSELPLAVVSYGYLPLMMTRNCPIKSGSVTCATCKKSHKLQDRKGEEFVLMCDKNVVEILNCVPLILPQEIYKSKIPLFHDFNFTVENSVENKEKIITNLREKGSFTRFTHGLYLKGVKNLTIF